MRDELFSRPVKKTDFEFNEEVAAVFDDMLDRSIPFYDEVQHAIVDLVSHFYQPYTRVYDLGCSTGRQLALLAENCSEIFKMIGIDNAAAMINRARERLDTLESHERIELITGDIREIPIEDASAVIMNYTLQFVRPLYRHKLIQQVYDGLQPGGILILSEKVLEDHTDISRMFADMYYQFKRRQGYSSLEISQKREMLENVLVPYKVGEQMELLRTCGFAQVGIFFKWHNFCSFIATKNL